MNHVSLKDQLVSKNVCRQEFFKQNPLGIPMKSCIKISLCPKKSQLVIMLEKESFCQESPLCPSDDNMFPFKLKRKQFPIRLSFAMTINKAQGQTIPNVGVYLPESVFSHGQLYVALSRGISRDTTKVLVKPTKEF